MWSDSRRPLRLERGNISLSNNISFRKLREKYRKKQEESSEKKSREQVDLRPDPLGTSIGEIQRSPFVDEPPSSDEDDAEPEKKSKLRSLGSIIDGLNLRHELRYEIRGNDGNIQSGLTSHTLTFGGNFDLTDKWGIRIGNLGYDFLGRGLSYAAISFNRKLHCWNMAISWFPDRGNTYQFAISVNSGTLSFLKYNYGQNNTDGFFGL